MYACYVYNSLKLDDLIAPGRQDLSYLGLQLVAYIYDEATETRVILCRGHDRLVSVTRLMVFNYLQYSATVTHILYCLSDAVLRSAEINSTDVAQSLHNCLQVTSVTYVRAAATLYEVFIEISRQCCRLTLYAHSCSINVVT
jgi:ActR/RegA family two-component response regulator